MLCLQTVRSCRRRLGGGLKARRVAAASPTVPFGAAAAANSKVKRTIAGRRLVVRKRANHQQFIHQSDELERHQFSGSALVFYRLAPIHQLVAGQFATKITS